MARKWLPEGVTDFKDRHGKIRYRFRRRGYKTIYFHSQPGTEEFREEYAAALASAPIEAGSGSGPAPFSYDALIASFYRTPKWIAMRPSSQKTYRGIVERFRAANGDKDVRRISTAAIDRKLGTMADTPAAANNLRKVLARLHRHAIKLGWRTDNPVAASDAFAQAGDGHHTWTESEIAQFEAQWPLGTRERLAMALLLYTALRRSDMVRLGRQHREGEWFVIRQQKTAAPIRLPIAPQLAEAIEAVEGSHLTYLVTQFGQPFTGDGFGNWFRRKCAKAGIPHCTPHGLRKAMSRRLAEAGATNQEGRAMTGHKSDRLFSHYASRANQGALAGAGMAKVVANLSENPVANLGKTKP